MSLSKEQKRNVRKALNGQLSVKKLQTSLEYHYLAWHWNWDEGIKPLEWIIQQPNCDRGTALLIYWHGAPTWFCQYENKQDVKTNEGTLTLYNFLKKIEKRVEDNFYTTQAISFDPQNDEGHDWTAEYSDKLIKSPIPEKMLRLSSGIQLKRNILTEFVHRDLNTNEIETVNAKISLGFNLLQDSFPDLSADSDSNLITKAIKDYIDLERKLTGGNVNFNSSQANVGWTFAQQIRREYGWAWRVYSWDDGDNEQIGLLSPDKIYILRPPSIVVLSIGRPMWENAIEQFFALIGTYTKTQDFRDFCAWGWMNLVPH